MSLKPALYVVDDDIIYHFLIARVLENAEWDDSHSSLHRFEDAREGLAHLQEHWDNYSKVVVLLDLNMPHFNGFQFLAALAEQNWPVDRLSVYIVTSSVNEDDRRQAQGSAYVRGYVVKPIRPTQVREILQSEF